MLESLGFDSVDINMGCPVRKVCNVGGGSTMMIPQSGTKTAALVRGMVEAVKIPVTAKMRLGWDDENITAPDLARALEDAGIAAIFVHGRTRKQGFGGTVNLDGIRAVVKAVKTIPVIGNGDIVTPQAAKKMLDDTGCAGVSIGRGAFYNPWIFQHTLAYCSVRPVAESDRATGSTLQLLPEPTFAERVNVMCRHLDLMIEVFGEKLGCRMFRKIAPWHAKRFGPCREFNKHVVRISTKAEFHDVLENYIRWRAQFLDANGELQSRFRPAPMVASFMRELEPASTQREQIPVPKGPVEVW
jgi:nifR3 family TIM-barrel protein